MKGIISWFYFKFVANKVYKKYKKIMSTQPTTNNLEGWEERFDEIINKWKEPDFVFERHDALIDYMSKTIIALKQFISDLRKQTIDEVITYIGREQGWEESEDIYREYFGLETKYK
jgi:hypothetical protein